jgi:tetratricopeptide (TPR) repeat protein
MSEMQDARQGASGRRTPRTIAGKIRPTVSASQQHSLQQYQNALQLMQEGKFDKARIAFEKLTQEGSPEIFERAKVYLSVCERNARKPRLEFVTIEEQYDYAISLLNTGDYEDARDHFENILDKRSNTDFAHYGLAVLNSLTGQAEECLQHLSEAIAMNPRNRIQARSDSDFNDMADDPRFTELLYPEAS